MNLKRLTLATLLAATPALALQPAQEGGSGQTPPPTPPAPPAPGAAGAQASSGTPQVPGLPPRLSLDQRFQMSGGSVFDMEYGGGATGTVTVGQVSPIAVRPTEPRQIRKYDLITVIVREESQAKSKDTTDLKKSNNFDAVLQQYFDLSLSQLALKGRGALANQPRLQYDMKRNFKGEGNTERTDSMSARVTAQVIDVKENGILVIQATKMIKNDEEEQKFILTGMVRSQDVSIDNSVLSTQLADLVLEKTTAGAARDTSKRGWIPRFFDKLNPF